MANKFDTNPLDPNFPEKAKAQPAGAGRYTAPQDPSYRTSEFPTAPSSVTEEETRRFADPDFQAYWQNAPAPAAPLYRSPDRSAMNAASNRTVTRFGMPEKLMVALPYLPFHIGLVAGAVELLVVQKEETKVRFHAAQGLAAQLAVLIVTSILGMIGGVAGVGSLIFSIAAFGMMIAFAIKAWKGKPVHIAPIDELTNFLEDKIGPIKS